MQLTAVRFEAFKSLYDLSCTLDQLTVITGPNGSGKSNFVDALDFLGEVYGHGLEIAVSRAGGYENIAHRRTRRAKKPIAFTVEVEIAKEDLGSRAFAWSDGEGTEWPEGLKLTFRHSFALRTAGQSLRADFEVSDESVELIDQKGAQVFRLTRDGTSVAAWVASGRSEEKRFIRDIVRPYGDKRYTEFVGQRPITPTSLILEQLIYANLLWDIKRALTGIRIFQLSPHECRQSGVPTPNANLERHGQNLPAAADHLRRNSPRAWTSVQSAMRAIIPGLTGIDVAYTEDRRLALQFREDGIGRPWTSGEVSDGTIQALALFIALFDDRSRLIVVEEPENSVHPWILRQFIDLCIESSRQVLLTSHSPVLLNYVPPEIVRLMSMRDHRSQIRRVVDMSDEVASLALSGELSLFDAYDSGVLPESVPRGFVIDGGA